MYICVPDGRGLRLTLSQTPAKYVMRYIEEEQTSVDGVHADGQ